MRNRKRARFRRKIDTFTRGPEPGTPPPLPKKNNKAHLLLPSPGSEMNSPALHVKVSSYVHFICKSRQEEALRHCFYRPAQFFCYFTSLSDSSKRSFPPLSAHVFFFLPLSLVTTR